MTRPSPSPVTDDGLVERVTRWIESEKASVAKRNPSGHKLVAISMKVADIEGLLALAAASDRDVLVDENARLRKALGASIETLAAGRHLIAKYTPDHHWLGEHDNRIAEARAALIPLAGELP